MATNKDEMTDVEYLRDLAQRLMHIPVMYGTNQYDTDRLAQIAHNYEYTKASVSS